MTGAEVARLRETFDRVATGGPDRPPVAGTTGRLVLVSAGERVDRRWFPGPLVAAAPNQGFEADVPAGWEVRPTWKGFELRPAPPPQLRRRLAGPVELTTTYLQAFYQPGGRERYQDGSQLPAAAMPRTPAGPELTRGQLPGGRSWFRTAGVDGRRLQVEGNGHHVSPVGTCPRAEPRWSPPGPSS